jgi:hypothetical protein
MPVVLQEFRQMDWLMGHVEYLLCMVLLVYIWSGSDHAGMKLRKSY